MADSRSSYEALLEKIAELGARQSAAFGEQIRCGLGCYECCRPPDSLFQVEAMVLEQVLSALPAETKRQIEARLDAYEAGHRELCPLLDEEAQGACVAYEGRPSICRTQGYALWLRPPEEATDDDGLSWCALNFTERTPQRPDAFDVERLNMMLSLITQLGWPNQEPRRSLPEILRAGIAKDADP